MNDGVNGVNKKVKSILLTLTNLVLVMLAVLLVGGAEELAVFAIWVRSTLVCVSHINELAY